MPRLKLFECLPLIAWLIALALLILRRPAVVVRPELWAEDGWIWWPDAYSLGPRSLLYPIVGYFQTVSRLVALAVQPFGLRAAPMLFATFALAIQALPVAILLSKRMQAVWPSLSGRVLFASLYVCLPNSFEEHANLTNAQWHLALAAFLILMTEPSLRLRTSLIDALLVFMCGLSGPFCLFLLPVALWRVLLVRDRTAAWRAGVVLFTSIVQGVSLLLGYGHQRSPMVLGAGLVSGARIIAGQVVLAPLLGDRLTVVTESGWLWRDGLLPVLSCLVALTASLAALRRSEAWRFLAPFGVFAGALSVACLVTPQVSESTAQWQVMAQIGAGQRYWLMPMLAWLGVLGMLSVDPLLPVRIVARFGIWVACLGCLLSFKYPNLPPTDFPQQASKFDAAPSGTVVLVGVEPPLSAPMRVIKR